MMSLKPCNSFSATVFIISLLSFSVNAYADENLASGTFSGASGHDTSGSVTLVKTANGVKLVLGEDFKFDGAPDAKVGFGKNGKYDGNSQLDALRANQGGQSYEVPGSVNIDEYNEVYIWCKQYSVSLGVAKIR